MKAGQVLISAVFVGAFFPLMLFSAPIDHEPILTPFNHLVLYGADVLALLLMGGALLVGVLQRARWRWGFRPVTVWLVALAVWHTASLAWALEPRLAVVTALHWWLVAGVYWAVINTAGNWRAFAPLAGMIIVGQVIVGGWQVASGSTLIGRWTAGWEKELLAPNAFTSVVMNAAGQRLLRAYGTTAHPNHLGGYAAVLALMMLGGCLLAQRRWVQLLAASGLAVGVFLLGLTFSRGAWIGFGLATAYLLLAGLSSAKTRPTLAVGILALTTLAFVWIFSSWIAQRVQGSAVSIEARSLQERADLASTALDVIAARPLTGAGSGNYMRGVYAFTHPSGPAAPVHNFTLLATGELGLLGGGLTAALYLIAVWAAWKARRDLNAAVSCALILAWLVANAFDVYAWSLGPSRLFFGVLLGFWSGSLASTDQRRV